MMVLAKYGFAEVSETFRKRLTLRFLQKTGISDAKKVPEHLTRAARTRMALQELGPTFIKLGQLLATRPDLLPPDYIEELEKLQDKVPPEKTEAIRQAIKEELGKDVDEIFKDFNNEPIAAGSIAQVHKAVTQDGKHVAIKVRRPGIVQKIHTECEILYDLAGMLKATLFKDDTIDPQRMIKEFNDAVTVEVNLANERFNQQSFYRNFQENPNIHIPQVHEQYCTEGILTMEFIDGIRPSNKAKFVQMDIDPKLVAQRGASFVLRQIFDLGFFHADPHPGNFFLEPESVLAPLDFGQVAHLSTRDRKLLNQIVLAIVDNQANVMIDALEHNEMLGEDTNIDKLTRDTEMLLEFYHGRPLKDIPFNKLLGEIFDIIRKHKVAPPPQFTLMLKSLATIESFAVSLDPDFQIIDQLKPYAKKFVIGDVDPKKMFHEAKKAIYSAGGLASRLPDDMSSIIKKFRRGDFQLKIHHEHLDNLVKTLDKSSNRISFALIIAALLIGSSMLVPQQGDVLGILTFQTLGIMGYIAATVIGIWLIISIIRSKEY